MRDPRQQKKEGKRGNYLSWVGDVVVALGGVLASSSFSGTSVTLRLASLLSEVGAVGDVGTRDVLELDGVVTSLVAAGEGVVAGEGILS